MRVKHVSPEEVITLTDFAVFNGHILKILYHMCMNFSAKLMPPCPVIHTSLVVPSFTGSVKKAFVRFEKKHPRVQYFLLDGSHKTTALSLSNCALPVFVIAKNRDIAQARKMVETGKLLSLTIGKTMAENISNLRRHFTRKTRFETVGEKTRRMITRKVIPEYMRKVTRSPVR